MVPAWKLDLVEARRMDLPRGDMRIKANADPVQMTGPLAIQEASWIVPYMS